MISPGSTSFSSFGGALAVRDGWLLATAGSPQPAWLFRVDAEANQIPRFAGEVPSQLVAGRAFSTEILADDADGNSGLTFDILQGPAWLQLADAGVGKANLSGVPVGTTDSVQTVQIRVRDTAGGQALYTWQLSLLAATSVPVLTSEPTGGDVGEGQEITLRAAVAGIGPFKWQWYLDGKPLTGANGSTLAFGEIQLSDSGVYTVSVTNAVGRDDSAAAAIQVLPANRFGGDWPTFGGSTRHTGFHPARLRNPVFKPEWSRQIHPTNPLNRVAVAEGRVFVSASSRFENTASISALDLKTGEPLWTQPIPSSNSINPPTWHNGTVYFQRGKGVSDSVGPQLIAVDAATGTRRWAAVFGAQWESYEAPAVTDDGIWINGGTYGGMYGFNLAGTQKFFRSLAQYDGWTPTISNGHVYSWVAGDFQEHNPNEGTTTWLVNTGWNWSGWTMNSVSAVSGNSAAVISTTELVCIDLVSHSIRWRKTGNFRGSPAISGGSVYGIQEKKVVSYSLADGTERPATIIPETIVSVQPLLVMDYLFVASAKNTYVIDRATSTIVRTLPGGGLLSFADAHLFAAGTDGTLRAWYSSAGLDFTSDPEVVANDRADDSQVDLRAFLFVPPGNKNHLWKLIGSSNPSLFSNLAVDQQGLLRISYAPYVSGTATVTVEVSDDDGLSTTARVKVSLPAPPAPVVKFNPAILLSRASGLYEQKVTVKNVAARAIGGFDLTISGLRSGVTLYNGASASTGGGVFSFNKPLAAGESVKIVLKYYALIRGRISQPSIVASLSPSISTKKKPAGKAAALTSVSPPAPPFAISGITRGADGSVTIGFPAEAGATYRMNYSPDGVHWMNSPGIIAGSGGTAIWIDAGPPTTETSPATEPRRFYRVERLGSTTTTTTSSSALPR